MTVQARVIADSISPQNIRLTTLQLRFPRFILAEFNTHRQLSRNASSSRAIPFERMIQDVRRDPVMPRFWGRNKPGMQAGEEIPPEHIEICKREWLRARDQAINHALTIVNRRVHKQIVNRLLEPWMHANVVVTATEWANFYGLRRHPDAQPEIHELADAMWEARENATPRPLEPGQWHLPYVEDENMPVSKLIKLSVARCARVSYLTHDAKKPSVDADLQLHDRLLSSVPLHASPAEHQATPDATISLGDDPDIWASPELHANFVGWCQYRRTLPNECIHEDQ